MNKERVGGSNCARALFAALMIGLACTIASADVSLLGVQYQEDDPFTEYLCYWHDRNYPTSCGTDLPGAYLHVFLKNDGASAVTLDDVDLETYSLDYSIRRVDLGDHPAASIWFRWDNPPQALLDAGEPAWYKMDPKSIPAGKVGQVIVRLRRIPVTTPLDVDVDTSANIIYADVTVDNTTPVLANVSFSQDLKKVYMYWRRANGTAPTTIKMDGTDITSDCETVCDSNLDMAVTVYTRSTALTELNYHVFQGIYSDSKEALGGIRVWINPFIYGSWAAFNIADYDYDLAQDWLDTCEDRGINTLEINSASSGLMDYLGTAAGKTAADAANYGFIKDDQDWGTWSDNPRLWFIDDEPDVEENTILENFCGTGYKLPCGTNQMGTMGLHYIDVSEDLRNIKNRPTTINLDGSLRPYSWAGYAQLGDVLSVDSYYEKRVMASHYYYPNMEPIYLTAECNYATALAGSRYSEPQPFRMLLFSCQANPSGFDPWPWADPETKRTEVYYTLAGGCKGINYWWFKDTMPSDGIDAASDGNLNPEDADLWKEIGLLGAEIKTLQPYLVTSYPADLDLTGSTDVWVKSLLHSNDTVFVIAINGNHYNDEYWHGTDTTNAHIYLTMPDWMMSPTPMAFEVSRRGLENVSTSMDGDEMDLSIGTLSVARMFIVTTNPELRMVIQDRYDNDVWPGICNFDSTSCNAITDSPSIVKHPSTQYIQDGGTASFIVIAAGGSQLSFQWQKDSSDLSNGGDISGATTYKLVISDCDSGHEADYRCRVTNSYGTATSNTAELVISTVVYSSHPSATSVCEGGTASFSVSATGEGTLYYQWQKDQSNLSNGGHYSNVTTATMTVSSAASADEADYRCRVTDNSGPSYSNEAALTISDGVTFSTQPEGVLIEEGETAIFTVAASGEGSLTYQWQKDSSNLSNGGDISGVTTTTLTIQNVDSGDEADYRCVVTDDCGSTNSNAASLVLDVCGDHLANGDFDDGFTGGVGNSWSSYVVGGLSCTFAEGGGDPYPGQRMDTDKLRNTRYFGVRQTVDAAVGDAFTFAGDVYCVTASNNVACSLRADWDGGTLISGASTVVMADQPQKAWTSMGYGSGNATGTSVTLFIDTRGYTENNVDGDSYYDNTMSYRAHVPVAPTVSTSSSTSLNVNVNPGCNSDNSDAQYAITIGGGAYTLGTHWVQTIGTVGTSEAWQTDSSWGTKEVTGLSVGVTYTFKVKARYSSTYTEDTSLGNGDSETTESSLSITADPEDQLICSGQTASFSVTASGDGTLTYQWRKDESDLACGGDYSGCTTSTLTIANVDSSDEADYECRVSDDYDTLYSDYAILALQDVEITGQPSAQDVCAGATAQFVVEANDGLGDVSYQWQKDSSDLSNGGDISGVTTTTLTIANVESGDAGSYRCVVTGPCDSANSNTAALTLKDATSITAHPSNEAICSGETAQFTVSATGEGTLSYQWQKDQSDLSNGGHYSGVTTATLTVSSADAGDEADYRCVVTGGCGSANSNEASLTLSAGTTITQHPSADAVCPGGTAQFTVAASGTGLSYQWQKDQSDLSNGGDISGATTATLTIDNVESGDAGDYRCVVTGDCGNPASNEAALTVYADTTITSHPSNEMLGEGETAQFTVGATGQGTLSYQWQKDSSDLSNGGDISGVTTTTLTIQNVESADEGDYRCVVTASCGSANSNTASLAIGDCGTLLQNGDFDGGFTSGIANNFTSYAVGGATPTFVSGNGNPNPGQRADYDKTRDTRFYGIRQLLDASAGDAFTFSADVWCNSNYFYATCALRTDWAGGTTPAESSQICAADQAKQTWTSLPYASGNTTSTQIMLFCDMRGTTSSNSDTDTYWDNVVAYRAHVPPAPSAENASSSSINVNVDPGCNSTNSDAQFAITISGGDYTEGTHWVQSDGSIGTSEDWQTDSSWGTVEVTCLTDAYYTFKVKARYSSTYTQATSLGSGDTAGWADPCAGLDEFTNGDFEDGFTSGVANEFTSYAVGGASPTFVSGPGNPSPGQRIDYSKVRLTRFSGVRQLIEDVSVGDAFTFSADVWCISNSNKVNCNLRTDWAGGTTPAESSQICNADQPASTWTALPYASGNTTSTSIMIFCDVRGLDDGSEDADTYWDNLVAYHAHVPDAPFVTIASSTSLNVGVDAGCNSGNSSAEYAITISGGGYTEGTHWVQSNGSISTSVVWQTDSSWGMTEVTGLTTSTTYTFKAKARYSSTYTEDTSLSSGTSKAPS